VEGGGETNSATRCGCVTRRRRRSNVLIISAAELLQRRRTVEQFNSAPVTPDSHQPITDQPLTIHWPLTGPPAGRRAHSSVAMTDAPRLAVDSSNNHLTSDWSRTS